MSDTVILEDGSSWTVTIAEVVDALAAQRRIAANGSAAVFLLLGLLAVGAAALFTRAVLSPIERLWSEIENRWLAGMKLVPDAYPEEIVPLVNDVNTLVERNHDIVARAQQQAADLAHALRRRRPRSGTNSTRLRARASNSTAPSRRSTGSTRSSSARSPGCARNMPRTT